MRGIDDFQDPWHFRDNNMERLKKFARDFGITLAGQDIRDYKLNY